MQNFNYHTHTYRCEHAYGEDREYVLEAIKAGYKIIGFSDHAPYTNGYARGERMHREELENYYQDILKLKHEFKDQIEIYIGLEYEYYKTHLDDLDYYRSHFDYLINGQHDAALYTRDFYNNHTDQYILEYANLIKEAADAGYSDIIAHPDLFMYGKESWTDACTKATKIICEAAIRNDVILELNLNGIRYGKAQHGEEYRYPYPYRKFWEIAANYPIKCIYGLDAHLPNKFADLECYEIINEIIKGLDLNILKEYRPKHIISK